MTSSQSKSWLSDSDNSDCEVFSVQKQTMTKPVSHPTTTQGVLKGISKKPSNKWVCSSFDDFNFDAEIKPKKQSAKSTVKQTSATAGQKRPRESSYPGNPNLFNIKQRVESEQDLWAEKHAPTSQTDLAVHKKKVLEVEDWLTRHLAGQQMPSVLLLTGPAGCGKTATIRVLAKQSNIEIQEWSNPITLSDGKEDMFSTSDFLFMTGFQNESQLRQFEDFLLRANRYPTLQIFGSSHGNKKVILIEDYPNTFFRDVAAFHDILRKYQKTGRCPLIFIVSDSAGGESNERLLFPKPLQRQLQITNISFNPVAPTMMAKILNKVAVQESNQGSHSFPVPGKETLEQLASSCAGDIRGAINALQFSCHQACGVNTVKKAQSYGRKTSRLKPNSKASSDKKASNKTKNSNLASIGGKDTTLFLFRALGKILYCKRDEPLANDSAVLPAHLSHHYRDPLLIEPEEVIEKAHLSPAYFTAYLHQNYVEFYQDIEDIVSASKYLSDADYLTTDWVSRSTLQEYASSVAARGLMFCNSSRARQGAGSGMGFKALHKPQWFTVMKKARDNTMAAKELFRGFGQTPLELQTETLPFLAHTSTPLHNPGQITFLQDLCKFPVSSCSTGSRPEYLGQDDVEPSSDTEDVLNTNSARTNIASERDNEAIISNSQSIVNASHMEDEAEDEDLLIEDFEDD